MNTLTEKERQAIKIKTQEALRNLNPVIDNDYKYGFCDGIDVGINILAELRKEEAPSEDLDDSLRTVLIMHGMDGIQEIDDAIAEIANLIPKQDVNAELLEALESLYESLPDGYTHESVLKEKAILHPIYAERNHAKCNEISKDEF